MSSSAVPSEADTARQFHYAGGGRIRRGEWALSEENKGRVLVQVERLVLRRDEALAEGLSGPGIVVRDPARGLAFLSEEWLREHPLRWAGAVREHPDDVRDPTRKAAKWLLAPSMAALLAGVATALFTGEVFLIDLFGDVEFGMAPWREGWGLLASPVFLAIAATLRGRLRVLFNGLLAPTALGIGATLLVESGLFYSPVRIGYGMVLAFVIASCWYVDKRFGRAHAFTLMVASTVAAVFILASR